MGAALYRHAMCAHCQRDVSVSKAGTFYAHGTRDDRCPGTGTQAPLHQAVGAALKEMAQMRKETNQ